MLPALQAIRAWVARFGELDAPATLAEAIRNCERVVLPEDLAMPNSRWLKNAIVQLGFNAEGKGILFVAEQHSSEQRNVLIFSDKGVQIEDKLLFRLTWAPILPVEPTG